MKKKKIHYQFETIIIPQKEGGFTAEVPDLPGCISEGESLEETEENIKEAISLYLETLVARGIPLPSRDLENVLRMNITVFPISTKKARYA